tara:strand:- start:26 stop:583 length:558 start_codon:yes stop_codon:yes gene_type:complete
MNTLSNTATVVLADELPSNKILDQFETVAIKSNDLKKNQVKLLDLLREDKVPYTHLLSPRGGALSLTTCPSLAYWNSIVGAVTKGLPKELQTLMATPAGALDQAQKDLKKTTRQEIGSVIGDIKDLLKAKPEKGPRMTYVGKAKANKHAQDYMDNIRKYEDMDHDVVEQQALFSAMCKKLGLNVK